MDEQRLRKDVVELLRGGHAHVTWDQALDGLPPAQRAAAPRRGLHTIWELVEHVRLAQEDILRCALEPDWKSPKWPEGYWPSVKDPTPSQWKTSLAAFRRDLEAGPAAAARAAGRSGSARPAAAPPDAARRAGKEATREASAAGTPGN